MRYGFRKPSFNKSFKARTTGRIKRSYKRALNPYYGRKGMGYLHNPRKALYNGVYHRTTTSPLPYSKTKTYRHNYYMKKKYGYVPTNNNNSNSSNSYAENKTTREHQIKSRKISKIKYTIIKNMIKHPSKINFYTFFKVFHLIKLLNFCMYLVPFVFAMISAGLNFPDRISTIFCIFGCIVSGLYGRKLRKYRDASGQHLIIYSGCIGIFYLLVLFMESN